MVETKEKSGGRGIAGEEWLVVVVVVVVVVLLWYGSVHLNPSTLLHKQAEEDSKSTPPLTTTVTPISPQLSSSSVKQPQMDADEVLDLDELRIEEEEKDDDDDNDNEELLGRVDVPVVEGE